MFERVRQTLGRLLLALLALAVVGAPIGALAAPCAADAAPCVACPMDHAQPVGDADQGGADRADGAGAPAAKSCGCIAMLKAVAEPSAMRLPRLQIAAPRPAVLPASSGLAPETEPRPPRSL